MPRKRVKITMTIDQEVIDEGKRKAGLVPFSRYVQHLIRKDVNQKSNSEGRA